MKTVMLYVVETLIIKTKFRSSVPDVFFGKYVLKISSKFTGEVYA